MPNTRSFKPSWPRTGQSESRFKPSRPGKMIPRNRPDIGWLDLFYGIGACFWPASRAAAAQRADQAWSPNGNTVVTLSVRSGFDLLLEALDLPAGSEILVSAVTIRDMTRIIEH